MRLSVHENAPHEYTNARIYLDGIERRFVVVADEEARYIEIVFHDDSGLVVLDGDEIKTQRLHGLVRIDLPNDPQSTHHSQH